MVAFSSLLSAGLVMAASVNAAPMHQKRIAQTIADSTTQWVAACTKAGGKDQCGTVSQASFQTLLAGGKNCDQQNAADKMVDLAKTLGNDPEMIRLSQIFAQQAINSPDGLQVPYCQTPPKNSELNGFFHCQFQGTVTKGFRGDQTGNTPLGVSNLNPPGSCPASKTPIPDGQQLVTLVKDPGTPSGGSGAGAGAAATDSAAAAGATDAAAASATDSAAAADATDAAAAATDSAAAADATDAAAATDSAAAADATDAAAAATDSAASADATDAAAADATDAAAAATDSAAAADATDAAAATDSAAAADATDAAAASATDAADIADPAAATDSAAAAGATDAAAASATDSAAAADATDAGDIADPAAATDSAAAADATDAAAAATDSAAAADATDAAAAATDSAAAADATDAAAAATDSAAAADATDAAAAATDSAAGAAASATDSAAAAGATDAAAGAVTPDPAKPFLLSNGQAAQKLNKQFLSSKAGDSCQTGSQACIGKNFAQCVNGKLQVSSPCAGGEVCAALPLVNKAGTSVSCDTPQDVAARLAATGVQGGITG